MPLNGSQHRILPKIILTEEKIKAARIKKIHLTPEKIFRPIVVEFPPNNYKTGRSLINFKGHAHRGIKLTITGASLPPVEVDVDHSGFFASSPIRLSESINTFSVSSNSMEQFRIPDSNLSLTVYFDNSLSPFFKRIDPITRTRLETVDVLEIVRCQACENFQLLATWMNCNICPICRNGAQYWCAEKDEFWST